MKVFVSASSYEHISKRYDEFLKSIANIANKHDDTVFVGGITGSMKELYENTKKHRAIVTKAYEETIKIVSNNEIIIKENSLERINTLLKECDMFVIMPGSIGTLLELVAVVEAKRNKEIDKKLIIVNIDGYYDDLLRFFDENYEKGFIKQKLDQYMVIVDDKDSLETLWRM